MKIKFTNTSKCIFYGIIFVTFLAILALNIMTPMHTDEFTYAFSYADGSRIQGIGDVITSMQAHYNINGGRIFAHAIVSFMTLFPWIISDILNSLVFIALGLLIYNFVFIRFEINSKMLAIIYIAMFITIPAFGQSALWFVGSVNYLWTITIMIAFLLPYMTYIITNNSKLNNKLGFLFIIWGFMMGACNENSSPATTLSAILMVIYMLYKKQKVKLWMILGIISSMITWAFVIVAPGNFKRKVVNGQDEFSLTFLKDCFMNCISLIRGEQKWLLIAVIILLILAIKYKVNHDKVMIASILIVGGMASNFAMMLSPTYPTRAFIATEIYVMTAGLILFYELNIEWIKTAKIFLIVYMCYIFAMNFIYAFNSNITTYIWSQQRIACFETELTNGNMDVTTYKITSNNPYNVFYIDYEIGGDPSHWINRAVANYYHLNSVVTTEIKTSN